MRSGEVTLTNGTVLGVVDAKLLPSGRKSYSKESGDWKLLASPTDDYKLVTASRTISITDRFLWASTNSGEITITIPNGLPNGTKFTIRRRGDNNLRIDTAGNEKFFKELPAIVDDLLLASDGEVTLFKESGAWSYLGFDATS